MRKYFGIFVLLGIILTSQLNAASGLHEEERLSLTSSAHQPSSASRTPTPYSFSAILKVGATLLIGMGRSTEACSDYERHVFPNAVFKANDPDIRHFNYDSCSGPGDPLLYSGFCPGVPVNSGDCFNANDGRDFFNLEFPRGFGTYQDNDDARYFSAADYLHQKFHACHNVCSNEHSLKQMHKKLTTCRDLLVSSSALDASNRFTRNTAKSIRRFGIEDIHTTLEEALNLLRTRDISPLAKLALLRTCNTLEKLITEEKTPDSLFTLSLQYKHKPAECVTTGKSGEFAVREVVWLGFDDAMEELALIAASYDASTIIPISLTASKNGVKVIRKYFPAV